MRAYGAHAGQSVQVCWMYWPQVQPHQHLSFLGFRHIFQANFQSSKGLVCVMHLGGNSVVLRRVVPFPFLDEDVPAIHFLFPQHGMPGQALYVSPSTATAPKRSKNNPLQVVHSLQSAVCVMAIRPLHRLCFKTLACATRWQPCWECVLGDNNKGSANDPDWQYVTRGNVFRINNGLYATACKCCLHRRRPFAIRCHLHIGLAVCLLQILWTTREIAGQDTTSAARFQTLTWASTLVSI